METETIILPANPPPAIGDGDFEIGRWVVDQGLTGPDLASLVEGLCEKLVASGLPLWRFYLAMPTANPDMRAVSLRWLRGAPGIERDGLRHDADPAEFQASPFSALIERGATSDRWHLGSDPTPTPFSILEELRAKGATDYLVHLVSFDATDTLAQKGCGVSFASDRAGGFSEQDVARLARLVPLLGLAAYRFGTSELLVDMLGCYVGRDAGRRVLRGEIRRGEGHRLPAALLFADLRGFTAVAESSGQRLIARLGLHLAAMAEPAEAQGGEVLKFLGGGLLAAFPIPDADKPGAACAAALAAGIDALARNAAANRLHPGEPPLLLDIALHRGEVFYGNVGAGGRLDFTVIGPAVNEASRIESMCGALDRPLLMSEPFAHCCGRPVVSLGHHTLRGVSAERELFVPV